MDILKILLIDISILESVNIMLANIYKHLDVHDNIFWSEICNQILITVRRYLNDNIVNTSR